VRTIARFGAQQSRFWCAPKGSAVRTNIPFPQYVMKRRSFQLYEFHFSHRKHRTLASVLQGMAVLIPGRPENPKKNHLGSRKGDAMQR